ncbi:MAG TPA: PilX N-terminal domain-containing pilus assembly protein [Steroidobacteraceae bacterium]|jgi:type IV pilus assembly protein PilX
MSPRKYSGSRHQSGAILVVSLLLLLVLTILGVVMMQTSTMQERMSGNTRDLGLALQGAEAGLRYGEAQLSAAAALPATSGTIPCAVCQVGILPVAIYDSSQFNWSTQAQCFGSTTITCPTASGAMAILHEQPQYTTESLGFVPDSLDVGQDPPEGRDFYQISAHSTGASGKPNTVLQSTFARRF